MSIDIPPPAKWFLAVRHNPAQHFPPFIDWESVSPSQAECEAYVAEWYEGEHAAVCEFELALRVVKEIGVEPEAVESGLLF